MHGLINRSIQCFLRDSYGNQTWEAVARLSGLGSHGFEAMMTYDIAITDRVIAAATQVMNRSRESVLEDLGIYLVSHATVDKVRRLLRFGGVTFGDFLNSLEDLPDRSRLAVPELDLPDLTLCETGEGLYTLEVRSPLAGMGHVASGLLRAMADDYGALIVLDYLGRQKDGAEKIAIQVLDRAWTSGRKFELAEGVL